MRAQLITCADPFRPSFGRRVEVIRKRKRLSQLIPKTTLPTICQLNGEWISRKEWESRRVRHGDTVIFVTLPHGGEGGSNPLKIILMIVVMVFAWWAAPYAATAIGVTEAVAYSGIVMLGSALVNALIPPPKPPSADTAGSLAAASPTYSLGAQGNAARLGQPIPSIYGRHLVTPDFAAMPYVEYVGNEQYLYQLFCIGQGKYSIEQILIEDTPISNFPEITTEIVQPGGRVTLFPSRVITSVEVAGQEPATGQWLGPFVVSAPGVKINAIGIDVVMPRGLYQIDEKEGDLLEVATMWRAEAQAIDDAGQSIGGWQLLTTKTYYSPWSQWAWYSKGAIAPESTDTIEYQVVSRIEVVGGSDDGFEALVHFIERRARYRVDDCEHLTASTPTPQRLSARYPVPEGRYQVRFTRLDTKLDLTNAAHDLVWAGMRGYVPGEQVYGDVTMLSMRMRASNSLSQQASRRIKVLLTRMLQTWSPASGWGPEVPTRSIAWAVADIARARYGGRAPDARIDLAGLYALDQVWASRGDYFDYIFDRQSTVAEALTLVSRAGRGITYQHGGILRTVRDAPATLPVQMFTTRNIVKGSLKLDYLMPSEETADAIDIKFWDARVWAERTVRCALPGSREENVVTASLPGVTTREHAWREGMYTVACNRYRRRLMSHSTEMEGFIPTLGDLIAVQHDLPKWGQSGEIVAWDAETKEAILSEPLDWSAGGAHVLAYRRRDGRPAGPYACTAGADAYRVILADWSAETDPTPDTGSDRERSHFAFGPVASAYIRARVQGIKPRGAETVELATVIESDYVHLADTGAPPPENAWQMPAKLPTLPTIDSLRIEPDPTQRGRVIVSWPASKGAEYYIAEQQIERGAWVPLSTRLESITINAAFTSVNTRWRVAAMGSIARGPWREAAWIDYRRPVESVSGFSIAVAGTQATLTLDPPIDDALRRLGRLHIRHSPAMAGAQWEGAAPLVDCAPASSVTVPTQRGTYLARWEDSLGQLSVSAMVVNDIGTEYLALNVVDVLDDGQAWPGAKSGVILDATLGGIKLLGAAMIDDLTLPLDAYREDWDSLGGIVPLGTYAIQRELNLGRVALCRLTPRVDYAAYAPSDLWDFRAGNIDDWESIDGPTISGARASIEISTSDDGVAWSVWRPLTVSDQRLRAIRARVVLLSDDPAISVVVRSASVLVDMPDLEQRGVDVVSSADGALRIDFDTPYQRPPVLAIAAQGMQPGDSYEITGKDLNGFSVLFRAAGGALVIRTFDWQTKGI